MKLVLSVCLTLLSLMACVSTCPGPGLLFKHMANNGDTKFVPYCDDCFVQATTSHNYRFFGKDHTDIFVSSNGYLTFDVGYSWYDPSYSSAFSGPKMVAPYWSDIYTPLQLDKSNIWYRETTDPVLLLKAKNIIQNHFAGCGDLFEPEALFIVTYQRLGSYCEARSCCYYNCPGAGKRDAEELMSPDMTNMNKRDTKPGSDIPLSSKSLTAYERNSFQVVLATDGCDTFAINNIHTIEWECCFSPNQMLFNAGDGVGFYMHPNPSASNLVNFSNTSPCGRWVYKISETKIKDPSCTSVGT